MLTIADKELLLGSQTGAVAKMAEERAIEAEEELDAAHGAAEEAEEARCAKERARESERE